MDKKKPEKKTEKPYSKSKPYEAKTNDAKARTGKRIVRIGC